MRVFVGWGGIERRKSKRGHRVVKMPNGRVCSFPTGVLKIGLLMHEIKMADKTEEEFRGAL